MVIVTNLSRSYGWFDKLIQAGKNLNYLTLVASWHREFADINEFAKKAKYLLDHGINVSVNVTFSVDLFDEYYKDAVYLKNEGLIVKALPQRITNSKDYTQEQLDILQQSFTFENIQRPKPLNDYPQNYIKAKDISANGFAMEMFDKNLNAYFIDYPERFPSVGFTNFEGWQCYAGFQNICIDEFGYARRGKAGCMDDILGNIFSNEDFIFKEPKVCTHTCCDAATDSVTRKIKMHSAKDLNRLRKA